MRFILLQEELKKLGYKIKVQNNEIYLETNMTDIKNIVSKLMNDYKLNFVAEFCREDKQFIVSVILLDRKHGYFLSIYYSTQDKLISLQDIIYQSHLFEREIADLYGLNILWGRDTRNIVKHEIWEKEVFPLRRNFKYGQKIRGKNEVCEYKFKPVAGEGGYQIAVGPVHAGIIEPGHFRFTAMGEQIENLEIRLMYKHRGIEKICENIDANKLNLMFERVAGESSAAYGEAYAQLIEKLTGFTVMDEIKALRVILLELERIYNYLDDIGGVCVDIGFSYPAKKFGYFSEKIHQLCERLTGSRFLRNVIVPCGINMNFSSTQINDILNTINSIKPRMNGVIEMVINSVSFLDRVENTGLVYNEKAKRLCMTGIAGRASGIIYDARASFKYEIYKEIKKNINFLELGGVFERFKLKSAEIKDAFDFIEKSIKYIKNDINKNKPEIKLEKGKEAIAIVETVKGELVVYGKTDDDNKFSRIYFKTPSFTNWDGLTYAVLNEVVPDFPLCNKSFNMSYSENDK